MIDIDSDQGRIGELWWINSQPSRKVHAGDIFPGLRRMVVLWGTCGIGRNVKISMEPVDD